MCSSPRQVELVNIGAADIVDGNHKLILGLIWSIILHWQVCLRVHASVCLCEFMCDCVSMLLRAAFLGAAEFHHLGMHPILTFFVLLQLQQIFCCISEHCFCLD